MQGPEKGNPRCLSDRKERTPRAAVVIATIALVSLAAVACSSRNGERPAGKDTISPSDRAAAFPTAAFADISEAPVSKRAAAEFQAALNDMAGGAGMAATVMSADGTWSGAVGKADGVRDVRVDDQFAIASVTKSLVAAQVMQMVEAGELALDDLATEYLPADLDFDTNGATIRQLLGQRSGIPDYYPVVRERLSTHRQRVWTPADLLDLVPADRTPAGEVFEYTDTNYLLLGLVIEQVRGRQVADVLRDGVLNIDGVERLIYQPDELPTEPMAMPAGESTEILEVGGGYLPSLAHVTSDGPAAAMASDSLSLARWWRAFCSGEIVSQASLTEMSTFRDEYGLGLYNPGGSYAQVVGHTGEHDGYVSWAGCLPEDGSVVVVLSNRVVEDIGGMARPLVEATRSDWRTGTAPSPEASPIEGPFGQVGGWIAYSSRDGIWVVDPAHPEQRIRLRRPDGDPIAWSSEGTKLLIRRRGTPTGLSPLDLYVLEADGTETRLTDADDPFLTGGSFSPDGSEVVYATSSSAERSAIYAVSSDGRDPRVILQATRRVFFPEEGRSVLTSVYHPALSPDGTQIAYFDGMGDHSHNLLVMNADGTERRLLLDEELPGAGAGHMRALTWSPDGEWLAFTTDDGIYQVRPDGTGLRLVVPGDFVAPAVQWSPNGSRIAYRRGALVILNVDSGNERIIEGIHPRWIAWNPAG